jgi:hypothetical protein
VVEQDALEALLVGREHGLEHGPADGEAADQQERLAAAPALVVDAARSGQGAYASTFT